jgi:quercetin dioxygenase-like cupin family protein
MHYILRSEDMQLRPAYEGNSKLFKRCSLVDRPSSGSVHTGLGLCSLDAGGEIDTHLHSFEESFYILEGEPTLLMEGHSYRLLPGACGFVPVGVPHAWLGPETGRAKWIDMLSPQPREKGLPEDTFFLGPPSGQPAQPLDIRDPRFWNIFRMRDSDIQVENLRVGLAINAPTVSASMATALLVYSGIAVKMLVDHRLGCQLSTMFMVEYQPGGAAHLHDHPLEEAYYILEGEVDAVGDGERYTLRAGDLFWTGVGCIHAFYNTTQATVRWLETQAPAPPPRYSYRFNRDWDYLREKLDAEALSKKGTA